MPLKTINLAQYISALLCCIMIEMLQHSTLAQRSEDYHTITEDGAWCWFSDPRAVYYDGEHQRTYTGFTTSTGDIVISSTDHNTNKTTTKVIYEKLQVDDHTNPSLLFLPDGKLMVFFTKHNGLIHYTTSLEPEDISAFSQVETLELGNRLCYTNPVMLSEESNRLYLFYRGGEDWKPTFVTSDDLGASWSSPQTIVSKKDADINNRPYTKVASDGKSQIHFAFTDGHPREENHNSIYYLKYEKGKFHEANGNVIAKMDQLPIDQELVPKAYDGKTNNQRAWIWDIAVDQKGDPAFVYTTLPEETKHYYNYSKWDGSQWESTQLTKAGSAFPRFDRVKENRDPEPHYSGGIALDHEDPNKVYLSVPKNNRFEIEEWITNDGGQSFENSPITKRSLKDNVRPFVVRNAPITLSPRVLWIHVSKYEHYTNYNTAIKGNQIAEEFKVNFSQNSIKEVMGAAADWQIENFAAVKHHDLDWTNGALYVGMMAWAKISPDAKYMDWLYALGQRYGWQPHKRMYHADDIVVNQMYLDMYDGRKQEEGAYRILGPTKARIDYVIKHPSNGTLLLDYRDAQTLERWSWCDALFMAPPVYTHLYNITGEESYLGFMDKEFKATYEFLYDKEEHLFYRDHRYFPSIKLEANGEKIFWGRGNGWVMGGLVAMLEDLPKGNKYRPFYEKLYLEMAAKVLMCQDKKGFWHASMLDHESYPNPEMSSTAFFTFALAYGVNSGLLDKDVYGPAVKNAWASLVEAVHADGKLGWVQPIGETPKSVTSEMTEVYGVGAFLLAGTEVLKLVATD